MAASVLVVSLLPWAAARAQRESPMEVQLAFGVIAHRALKPASTVVSPYPR